MFQSFAPRLNQRRGARDAAAIGWAPSGPDWGVAVLVWLLVSGLLLAFEAYLQNAHIETANGLWDSVELRRWIADPRWETLDLGNAIYLPVYGVLCKALTRLGVFPDLLWRQMAVLDALFAALGLAGVYLFVVAWLRDRAVALLAVVLYGGSGFYLLCSIEDEWDMPSQSFILFATLLACAWFARPRVWRIAAVAILFSISWLFEWRFLFPALPPMLLALFLAPGRFRQRIVRPALFVVFMSLPPLGLTAAYLVTGGATLDRAAAFLIRLFWVGKGMGTGWGGFAAVKAPLAAAGVGESFVGARNIDYGRWTTWPAVGMEIICGLIICLSLLVVALRYAWRNRTNDTVVIASILLGGTLVGGSVFNLYSQPQDPQMLINVMIWTVPAWALVAKAALGRPIPVTEGLGLTGNGQQRRRWWLRPLLIALALAPTAYNISVMAQQRGRDSEYLGLVSRLGQRFDPRRTVFLYHGFEGIFAWQFASWDGSWCQPSPPPPAPTPRPTFKMIDVTAIPVNHPDWSVDRQVGELKRQIDAALDGGYQIVAGPELGESDALWVNSFLTVAPAAVPQAMRRMIEATFVLTPVHDDAFAASVYDSQIEGKYAILTR
jgi:hypothetical protein